MFRSLFFLCFLNCLDTVARVSWYLWLAKRTIISLSINRRSKTEVGSKPVFNTCKACEKTKVSNVGAQRFADIYTGYVHKQVSIKAGLSGKRGRIIDLRRFVDNAFFVSISLLFSLGLGVAHEHHISKFG